MTKFIRGFFLFLLFISTRIYAQQQIGLMHGRYNVMENININPASAVAPLPYLDIHVVGAHAFLDNNYGYLKKSDFAPLIGRMGTTVSYNESNELKTGEAYGVARGPGFNLSYLEWAFGASLSVRSVTSFREIPYRMAAVLRNDRSDIHDTLNTNTYDETGFTMSSLLWSELAIHVGRIVYQNDKHLITVAGRPKLLVGMAGQYLRTDAFKYTPLSTTRAQFDEVSGEYTGTELGLGGFGWGLDIGVEYRAMEKRTNNYVPHSAESGCRYIPYRWKVGLAVLDIGRIQMNRNSYYRSLSSGSAYWDKEEEYNYWSSREFIEKLDSEFGNTVDTKKDNYTVGLPTAISLTGDFHLKDDFWLGAGVLLAVPKGQRLGSQEMTFVSVTPRYETRYFEIAVPISANQLMPPNLGLAARVGPFQFGTDNLISYLVGDAYRFDAYASFTIDIVESGRCGGSNGTKQPFWRFNDCSAPKNNYKKPKKKK